jgi:hypothetical protein
MQAPFIDRMSELIEISDDNNQARVTAVKRR